MAIDSTLEVRRAGLVALLANAAVTSIVGTRVYPMVAPSNVTWPFVVWGSPSGSPIRAACVDGMSLIVAVHGFAKARYSGSTMIETAEDHAGRLGAEIAAALDRQMIDIAGGTASFTWTGPQLLVDGSEADAFHTVQNFRVRCVTG